ncbi:MAG: phosphotransferase family protein [bacterium]|nr:phosphotransferase family protein [bacterium]
MADGTRDSAIAQWVRDVLGWSAAVTDITVERLDGGYSWQTYRVTSGAESAIARIAPEGGTVDPYDADEEATVLTAARAASIPAPEVLAIDGGARFGTTAAIHTDLPGEAVRPGADINPDDASRYRTTFAETLASIHTSMPAEPISITEAYRAEIAASIDHYVRTTPCSQPGFDAGWQWLVANLPGDDRPAVQCHGDYRLSNLLWSRPGEMSAVLDWERAWTGDPMCDVAFTRLFSGWCSVEGPTAARYEAASGISVDEDRLNYAKLFERWRSYTSGMRGLAAYTEGRNDDDRLVRIGLAGEAGVWRLTRLLSELDTSNIEPSPHPQPEYRSLVAQLGSKWSHVIAADEAALTASIAALQAIAHPSTDDALSQSDPEAAYREAHAAIVATVPESGAEMLPVLQALSVRATLRFDLLEESQWR